MGRPAVEGARLLLRQVEGAVAAGVPLVQIRERDLDARALLALTREAVRLTRGSTTRILVNDRVDVALAAGADGVHLRETSVAAGAVRQLAPHFFVGRSVHSADSAAAAGPVDYLIAGTVFGTASKPQAPTLGLAGLADIVRAAGDIPVLAIGGVDAGNVAAIAETGAAGVAAIGAFLPASPGDDIARATQENAATLRASFDRASRLA